MTVGSVVLIGLLLFAVSAECLQNFTFCDVKHGINSTSGFLISHKDFGKTKYPYDIDCAMTLLGKPDKLIRLTFEFFNLEGARYCPYDYLLVHDGNSSAASPLGRFCGNELPDTIMSSGQQLYLKFITDDSYSLKGFKIKFEVISPPVICGKDEFKCNNGNCTALTNRCNGENNCGDNSDESACPSTTCGTPSIAPIESNTRIVGGREAKIGSWPWMAQLLIYKRSHYCGASLINNRWLVTAAHCTHGRTAPRLWQFTLGSHRTRSTDTHQIFVDAEKIINHPDYDNRRVDYDIALVKLTKEVEFTSHISPVCLASTSSPPGTFCYATGWGDTQDTGSKGLLKQAKVPLVSQSVCNSRDYYDGRISPRMMCAGYEEGGHDACQGDSGGPLVCKTPAGKWELHGITSWGAGCAGAKKPGVYARVSELYHWILDTMVSEA